MPRHDEIADRMAAAVVKRLATRKIVDVKDESGAKSAIRHVVMENLASEDRLDADARKLLLEHAKLIKDFSADYRQVFTKVKEKLARERGFIL
jgi:hypothetical protein